MNPIRFCKPCTFASHAVLPSGTTPGTGLVAWPGGGEDKAADWEGSRIPVVFLGERVGWYDISMMVMRATFGTMSRSQGFIPSSNSTSNQYP